MPILHWLDRERDVKAAEAVPFRLLEAVDDLSYGDPNSANMLIQGDNLEALKSLLPYYAGHVKCIFIDPPYNTRSAFEHYDDNLEHSQWLSMMYPRLELLRELLAEDGSIWITIDDNEAHYLKVILDEIFGRRNFIANIVWQKKYTLANDAIWLSDNHDHILLYAKNKSIWRPNKLPRTSSSNKTYKNPDNDPRGVWMSDNYTCNKSADERPNLYYAITNPFTGETVWPKRTAVWRYDPVTHETNIKENLVYWGVDGKNRTPRYKRFLNALRSEGRVSETIWLHQDVGHTQDAKRECLSFNTDYPFSTPKPEKLIYRILHLATNLDDLVLDSFLGSGTTAAVAQKMGRRFIGIEMGDQAITHCQPRLRQVVDGEQGGISKAVNWQGGGGFRFYRLGPPVFDSDGHINPEIKFHQMAAHIWFSETKTPFTESGNFSPFLGIHNGVAYYLLFNGILGDKTSNGGNVLTYQILKILEPHDGPRIIYGEMTRISIERLKSMNIQFKQFPYDLKAK